MNYSIQIIKLKVVTFRLKAKLTVFGDENIEIQRFLNQMLTFCSPKLLPESSQGSKFSFSRTILIYPT